MNNLILTSIATALIGTSTLFAGTEPVRPVADPSASARINHTEEARVYRGRYRRPVYRGPVRGYWGVRQDLRQLDRGINRTFRYWDRRFDRLDNRWDRRW